jgi:DNA-binding CsgD family transcriptional regulator
MAIATASGSVFGNQCPASNSTASYGAATKLAVSSAAARVSAASLHPQMYVVGHSDPSQPWPDGECDLSFKVTEDRRDDGRVMDDDTTPAAPAMDDDAAIVQAARDALARRDWAAARRDFLTAKAQDILRSDDVYSLAEADWWLGLIKEALAAYEESYHRYLKEDRRERAAMSALELAGTLFLRGDHAEGSGWLSRFHRLLNEIPEGVEHAYAKYVALDARAAGMPLADVVEEARRIQEVARRHGDPNLAALTLVIEGRAMIKSGWAQDGMALLDEAMLDAMSDQMNPAFAGNIYCNMIAACHEVGDLRRMREWTKSLARWCKQIPPAVLFTGICRVHQAQLLAVSGSWEQAEREASRVCIDLQGIQVESVAEAHYAVGEVRLRQGDLAGAESSLEQADRLGRDPQPALAMVRLAQGYPDRARTMLDLALAARTGQPLASAPLLAALVDVALDEGDLASAREAADELAGIAASFGSEALRAAGLQATGAVLVSEAEWLKALPVLREACRIWQDLDAPYDAARVRLLLAEACKALLDADGATRALDAAAEVFDRLGAKLEVRKLAALRQTPSLPDGLTEREAEVLALVAAGRTNREIADALVISHKTVARHLSNIFAKCGLTTRAAATAYAFEHHLISRNVGNPTHRPQGSDGSVAR